MLPEDGHRLDSADDCDGKQLIAVELDGPSHFVGREPAGAALLKLRQLNHSLWLAARLGVLPGVGRAGPSRQGTE